MRTTAKTAAMKMEPNRGHAAIVTAPSGWKSTWSMRENRFSRRSKRFKPEMLSNRRNVLCSILVCVIGCIGSIHSVAAQTPAQTAAALEQKALTNSGAVEIVRDLTTDIGPRLDGSEAEKRAAAWAAKRFQ
jgi:hypothetical protein